MESGEQCVLIPSQRLKLMLLADSLVSVEAMKLDQLDLLGNNHDHAWKILYQCCRIQEAIASIDIWLDDVRCSSTETTLLQCSHNSIGDNNCDHSQDVALECSSVFTLGLELCSNILSILYMFHSTEEVASTRGVVIGISISVVFLLIIVPIVIVVIIAIDRRQKNSKEVTSLDLLR